MYSSTYFFLSIILFSITSALHCKSGNSETVKTKEVSVTLLSEYTQIANGQKFKVFLKMNMEPGWHTYYKDPGDSGMPTEISWELPVGFTASEIEWPKPTRFENTGIVSYGYKNNLYLTTTLQAPEKFDIKKPILIKATINWLACNEICIPGEANLELNLTTGNDSLINSKLPPTLTDKLISEQNAIPQKALDTAVEITKFTFWQSLLFAFIGGILLNAMPCVFPVLGIKVMGFVNQAGSNPATIRQHGWVFTMGVLVSFWLLSGLLIGLRSSGEQLGWGFQLQNPYFNASLIMLLFTFGLNLLGVFEWGNSLISIGTNIQRKEGLVGTFFSGILATVVATPCTGPFMGTALGYALSLSAVGIIAIFTSLAIGLSFPYLILSFYPSWIKRLPRPGAWMNFWKELLAFPLFATVVWLLWVFGTQTNIDSLIKMLFAIFFIALMAWVWKKGLNPIHSLTQKALASFLILGLLTISGKLAISAAKITPMSATDLKWETYSNDRLKELVAEGKSVYVDFTAKWCLQCQVNKKLVFQSSQSNAVIKAFKKNNVVPMLADWTQKDPEITQALENLGRVGVPLNAIYSSKLKEPLILPSILSAETVIEAVEKL